MTISYHTNKYHVWKNIQYEDHLFSNYHCLRSSDFNFSNLNNNKKLKYLHSFKILKFFKPTMNYLKQYIILLNELFKAIQYN